MVITLPMSTTVSPGQVSGNNTETVVSALLGLVFMAQSTLAEATSGPLLEAWLSLIIGYEVLKPVCVYGN